MMSESTRRKALKHAWNAFRNTSDTERLPYNEVGATTSFRPDRPPMRVSNERSVIISVFNRIALDISGIAINHVRLDDDDRFQEIIPSGLNNALNVEANLDQTGRAFILDVVMSLFDEGCVAVIPTDTTIDPRVSGSYEIQTLRTGRILEWYPSYVRVRVYNEKTGVREDILLPKKTVAIVENPLYSVMNEPNSTLKRLIRKLNLLDAVDEQSGSGKLDLIIQLPFVIKSQARRDQAEQRRQDISDQLANSKYGIAYTDATERITQLNRAAENNLMKQVEYLTNMLYSQLGISEDVFTGKADEAAMLNYHGRTILPVLSSIVDEFKRKFLTKTARSQKQTLMYFTNPFALVPANELANVADKFTRNEILSSNEVRAVIGYKPSKDPAADELRNKNLNRNENAPEGEEKEDKPE
jgi:hypothetical protein